ncbi:unnamed protein product, partial [Musa textilis]
MLSNFCCTARHIMAWVVCTGLVWTDMQTILFWVVQLNLNKNSKKWWGPVQISVKKKNRLLFSREMLPHHHRCFTTVVLTLSRRYCFDDANALPLPPSYNMLELLHKVDQSKNGNSVNAFDAPGQAAT